jgi:hypothetical protein
VWNICSRRYKAENGSQRLVLVATACKRSLRAVAESSAADELCKLIETADVAPDELAMVVAFGFRSGWIPPGGQDVLYGTDDKEIGLRLTYAKSGRLVAAVSGPALTEEVARAR